MLRTSTRKVALGEWRTGRGENLSSLLAMDTLTVSKLGSRDECTDY